MIPEGTPVPGIRGDTQREAPVGRAAVATPHPEGDYLPSGGGRWVDAVRRGTRTRPPSLPRLLTMLWKPLSVAMRSFFSLMRRGRRRETTPTPAHFYFCLKPKSQLQRLKMSTEAENGVQCKADEGRDYSLPSCCFNSLIKDIEKSIWEAGPAQGFCLLHGSFSCLCWVPESF